MSFDWTNVGGVSLITGPRDQGSSNFCWGFACTAVVEAMVRINHGLWCPRSEGDAFYGLGWYWLQGGNPIIASTFIAKNGLADPDCLPWLPSEANYTFPESAAGDRDGRAVRTPEFQEISGTTAQQDWISLIGPITASFDVWSDFEPFYKFGSGVYQPSATATGPTGVHIVCLVGFDDAQGCWIAKNSWGSTAAHPDTIFRIAYGAANIDGYAKFGLPWVNPDPWTRRRCHAGGLFVSGNGPQNRNLELIVNAGGVFRQYYKDVTSTQIGAWVRVGDFGSHHLVHGTLASDVAATATSFNRNFEIVGLFQPAGPEAPLQHWVFPQRIGSWNPATPAGFGPFDATGTPAFLQGNRSAPGDFEVIVRTTGGPLSHWRRRNAPPWTATTPIGSWSEAARFASGIILGPTAVQARAGSWPLGEQGGGNIHLVCVNSLARLEHWVFRPATAAWTRRSTFAANVTGEPKMIEGPFGGNEWNTGALQLLVPVDNGVELWQIGSPDQRRQSWSFRIRFAGGTQSVVGFARGSRPDGYDVILQTRAFTLDHWLLAPVGSQWQATFLETLP